MALDRAIMHTIGSDDQRYIHDVEFMEGGWVAARLHHADEDKVYFSPAYIEKIVDETQ